MIAAGAVRKIDAHEWAREFHEHYVEPEWCSARLFDVEKFVGSIDDPCCGFGRIPRAATAAGFPVFASDIVDRSSGLNGFKHEDFLRSTWRRANIVCNPPFDLFQQFARHALELTALKVAMLWLVRRMNAARWLEQTPLARVYLLTPRPSMPPGHVITSGQKPGGGKQDFCWLVWDHEHRGPPELRWLHRDPQPRELRQ